MRNIEAQKAIALKDYKEKRAAYMENPTEENWIAFCDAKIACRRWGCLI